jgi:hypothetical protein
VTDPGSYTGSAVIGSSVASTRSSVPIVPTDPSGTSTYAQAWVPKSYVSSTVQPSAS